MNPFFLRDAIYFLVDEITLHRFPGTKPQQAPIFLKKLLNIVEQNEDIENWLWIHQCLFERLAMKHEPTQDFSTKRKALISLRHYLPLLPALDTSHHPQIAHWPPCSKWTFSEFTYFMLWLYRQSGHDYHFLYPHHPFIPVHFLQTAHQDQLIDDLLYECMMGYAKHHDFLEIPCFNILHQHWKSLEMKYHLNQHLSSAQTHIGPTSEEQEKTGTKRL